MIFVHNLVCYEQNFHNLVCKMESLRPVLARLLKEGKITSFIEGYLEGIING